MSILERKLPLMCDQHMCILGWKLNEIVDALYKKDPSSVDVVPRISSPDGDFILNGFHRTINALTEHLGIADFPQLNMMDDYQMRIQHIHLNRIIEKVNGLKIEPNYLPRTDGRTQYYNLSDPVEIPADTDFKISFYIQGTNNNSYEGLMENTQQSGTWLRLLPSNQVNNLQGYDGFQYFGGISRDHTSLRDGQTRKVVLERVSGSLYISLDNQLTVYARKTSSSWTFDRLCKFSNTYFGGLFYKFEVEIAGNLHLSLPLTNKSQGATQLPDFGNISATMANYTDAIWEEVIETPLHYALPDGNTQYWKLSDPLELLPDDIVEFKFKGGAISNTFATFIGTTNFAIRFDVDSTNSYLREQGLSAYLNGEEVDSGTTAVPQSGDNVVSFKVSSIGSLEQIASIAGSRLLNLAIYDFMVLRDGVVIHRIPLTNKSQGATQLPLKGSVSATMEGYDPLMWKEDKDF